MNSSLNIGVVVSKFNEQITTKLHKSTLRKLKDLGIKTEQISSYFVPGAIEIPIAAQSLILSGKYQAIIVLGAVIRGETSHYDYVCQQVSYGCQKITLKYNIPVIFGILTTDNIEQAFDRVSGEMDKGVECANTAIQMIRLLASIRGEDFANN